MSKSDKIGIFAYYYFSEPVPEKPAAKKKKRRPNLAIEFVRFKSYNVKLKYEGILGLALDLFLKIEVRLSTVRNMFQFVPTRRSKQA